eukprot:Rhum_TRINITY_DN15351_c3_g2::Rhum_TRINITY_DN15351_c3_g2_i1::g.152304::m.152304
MLQSRLNLSVTGPDGTRYTALLNLKQQVETDVSTWGSSLRRGSVKFTFQKQKEHESESADGHRRLLVVRAGGQRLRGDGNLAWPVFVWMKLGGCLPGEKATLLTRREERHHTRAAGGIKEAAAEKAGAERRAAPPAQSSASWSAASRPSGCRTPASSRGRWSRTAWATAGGGTAAGRRPKKDDGGSKGQLRRHNDVAAGVVGQGPGGAAAVAAATAFSRSSSPVAAPARARTS